MKAERAKRRLRCAPCCIGRNDLDKNHAGQDGFTLLETVLALFLLLLIIQGVTAVFWHSFLIARRQQELAELQYSARRARQYLSLDLAKASQVQIKDSSGQNALSGPHLHLTISTDMVHYYQYGGQLFRDTATGSPLPLAEHIESLSFSQPYSGTMLCRIVAAGANSSLELWSHLEYSRYSERVIRCLED